jgi:hypothetical protein
VLPWWEDVTLTTEAQSRCSESSESVALSHARRRRRPPPTGTDGASESQAIKFRGSLIRFKFQARSESAGFSLSCPPAGAAESSQDSESMISLSLSAA